MEVGLNLFSIRNLLQSEKDFRETLKKVKDMGYSYVQYSGAEYNPDMIKRVTEDVDIPVCLTHVPLDRILNESDKLMEEHKKFGCKNIGLGSLKFDYYIDEKLFKNTIDRLQNVAVNMKKNGFKFFYHHHHSEFCKIGQTTGFDYIVDNAPDVNITLDTYWVQNGGADVIDTIKRVSGRIECVHLKDYKVVCNTKNDTYQTTYAPVGSGNMNFNKIIETMRACGTKYYLVEQDDAADLPNTLELVNESVDYLKTL